MPHCTNGNWLAAWGVTHLHLELHVKKSLQNYLWRGGQSSETPFLASEFLTADEKG